MTIIKVREKTIRVACGACPTIFEFEDSDNNSYYFRLRHGGWRLVKEQTIFNEVSKLIVQGESEKFNGACDWEDVVDMVGEKGVHLVYNEDKYVIAQYLFEKYCEADSDEGELMFKNLLEEIE